MKDLRRITLVNHNPALESRDWDCSPEAASRIIFVRSVAILKYALKNAVAELNRDVERVVIDRGATAGECLDLLARLPDAFHGDVLIVRQDGPGFLSASSRGDGRVLYPLSADDIEFYLITHGMLVEERVRMSA